MDILSGLVTRTLRKIRYRERMLQGELTAKSTCEQVGLEDYLIGMMDAVGDVGLRGDPPEAGNAEFFQD